MHIPKSKDNVFGQQANTYKSIKRAFSQVWFNNSFSANRRGSMNSLAQSFVLNVRFCTGCTYHPAGEEKYVAFVLMTMTEICK